MSAKRKNLNAINHKKEKTIKTRKLRVKRNSVCSVCVPRIIQLLHTVCVIKIYRDLAISDLARELKEKSRR